MTDGREERVRSYLASRGAPEHVVRGGLERLLDRWEATSRELASGYGFDVEDYLNDMDGRQILEDVREQLAAEERADVDARIAEADARARAALAPTGRCIWGDEVAEVRGLDPERNWWYFGVPATRAVEPDWM